MIWLLLLIPLFLLALLVFKCIRGRLLLKRYQRDSLIVFGKKGKGKTLLFSEMTRNEKRGYLSTTSFYHKGEQIIDYDVLNVAPNDWESVLNGKITPIDRKPYERMGVYLDDAGIFLPNFADSMLKKKYPSMPIAYAVWRHLYNAPIHINSQAVERTYKLIREQADGFIQVRGCIRFFGFAFIRCTYYDRINSAKMELSPMPSRIFNKFSKAEVDQFRAMNGEITDFLIFAPTWRNKYDDRYFKSVFFKEDTSKA